MNERCYRVTSHGQIWWWTIYIQLEAHNYLTLIGIDRSIFILFAAWTGGCNQVLDILEMAIPLQREFFLLRTVSFF